MSALPSSSFTIEIRPKKPVFDPLARDVEHQLKEAGEEKLSAGISTRRLYKIEGAFTPAQMTSIAESLFVDPVVETFEIRDSTSSKKTKAPKANSPCIVDIWLKPGVTDPVGETVEKGLRDLGFQGPFKASAGQQYIFSKIRELNVAKELAQRFLANGLIHDIRVRKAV